MGYRGEISFDKKIRMVENRGDRILADSEELRQRRKLKTKLNLMSKQAKSDTREKKKQEFKKFAARKPELTVLTDHALKPDETYLDGFNLRYRLGPVYDIL